MEKITMDETSQTGDFFSFADLSSGRSFSDPFVILLGKWRTTLREKM